MIALLLLLLLICLYLLDEFEHEHSVILIGCVTSMVVVTIVGMTVFRLTFYHSCPMCNRKLGNIGDIVSRQIVATNFTVCFGFVQPTIFPAHLSNVFSGQETTHRSIFDAGATLSYASRAYLLVLSRLTL